MVVMLQPWQMLTGVRQEFTLRPGWVGPLTTVTMQAPQPPSPHDTLVPVSRATSRIY